ncbi:uncharacterized protein BDZ99DRAFT_231249 [Mytilinidion resinicola]|uniref:Uncharacterized protein n=1 Tax=Mytilinidion resinicola TaxID=574789 RepID=A0A6A6Z1M7_9PEZI|nr:uncharacterized protein BDZ99DRAFT_231249 [Mytilinidion resinicola]KAF2814085.1 hypothetical protein BDZ99DRAFT_231249 [Mytilinidion resinicola]
MQLRSGREAQPDQPGPTNKRKRGENAYPNAPRAKQPKLAPIKRRRRKANKTVPDEPWAPTGPFRFLDLPRELRDMVYGHIFNPLNGAVSKFDSPIIIQAACGERVVYDHSGFRLKQGHAIVQSCKQVCNEVKDTIYGLNGDKIPLPSDAVNGGMEGAFMVHDFLVS